MATQFWVRHSWTSDYLPWDIHELRVKLHLIVKGPTARFFYVPYTAVEKRKPLNCCRYCPFLRGQIAALIVLTLPVACAKVMPSSDATCRYTVKHLIFTNLHENKVLAKFKCFTVSAHTRKNMSSLRTYKNLDNGLIFKIQKAMERGGFSLFILTIKFWFVCYNPLRIWLLYEKFEYCDRKTWPGALGMTWKMWHSES